MQNAYKCNACGFVSYSPGSHHDQNMVRVMVEDNIRIGVTGPPVPTQAIGTRETAEETKQRRKSEDPRPDNQVADPSN